MQARAVLRFCHPPPLDLRPLSDAALSVPTPTPYDCRRAQAAPGDERHISDLLTEQVEFADVVLLNKCDLCDKAALLELRRVVASLNPYAEIVETTRSEIDLGHVLSPPLT